MKTYGINERLPDYKLDPPEDPPECPAEAADGGPCDAPLRWAGTIWVCPACGWSPIDPEDWDDA